MSATRPIVQPPDPARGNGAGVLGPAVVPPRWLRDLGMAAWLVVGIAVVLVGVLWALAAAMTIVGPLIAGGIVATVASPLVARLQRHHLGRGWGALIVLLALIAVAVVILLVVLHSLMGQANSISTQLAAAADKIESWLKSMGADSSSAKSVKDGLTAAAPKVVHGMAGGLVAGVKGVTSIALGVSFTAFAVFFLLKDGPALRDTMAGHLRVPLPVGTVIVRRLIRSIRGYFLGTTIVASFNGVVVGLGAWLLGVPAPAAIGVVTFALAYVPFIGAFVAGAFAVLLALGANGTSTAIAMLVIALLANGLLQNIVAPFAMGAALQMNPLLNLAVTVGAGCLFGMFGLILAAPLTSAAMHIAHDLRTATAEPEGEPAAVSDAVAPSSPAAASPSP